MQLERVKEKLELLKRLDKKYSVNFSNVHKYILNPPLPESTITDFEQRHSVILPRGYVEFLTKFGNGGAGPFYGLEPFENALFCDLQYKNPDFLINPGKPFPHTEPWDMEIPSYYPEDEMLSAIFDEEYYASKWIDGSLRICDYGCAIHINLVVKGQEYGHVWTDGRGNDELGIHPSYELGNTEKLSFLDWYELWLDNSIEEVNNLAMSR